MFRHPNDHPLDPKEFAATNSISFPLAPFGPQHPATPTGLSLRWEMSRIAIRLCFDANVNVGARCERFEVENLGNVPCRGGPLCLARGKWESFDGFHVAGCWPGNEFPKARVSCMAGPLSIYTSRIRRSGQFPGQKITALPELGQIRRLFWWKAGVGSHHAESYRAPLVSSWSLVGP